MNWCITVQVWRDRQSAKETRWSGRWCKTWAVSPEIVTVQQWLLLRRPSSTALFAAAGLSCGGYTRSRTRRREKDGNHPYQTTYQPPASTPHKASLRPREKNPLSFVPAEAAGHASDHPPLFVGHPWTSGLLDCHEHYTNGTSKNPSLFLSTATNSSTYAHGWIIRVCFLSAVEKRRLIELFFFL